MIKLKIISATDRPGANALKVARYLAPKYEELGAEVSIISLRDYPIKDVAGGKYGQQINSVDAFNEQVLEADALVLIVPEYNGSYPGILKLFIDYLPYPHGLEKIPICIVGESSGTFGALRAVEQIQAVFGYRNAYIFPERVFIPRVKQNFDPETGIRDEFQQELLIDQIRNFYIFTKGVKEKELTGRNTINM
ncbi:MAG TPA: NAD(P)H-dependent oxidoreductase [Balneolales bacterium]|nr:NAD(P)H-dependent oxidoreductase [Balneolales bacterium]